MSTFYRVDINTITGPANSDGFIDNTTVEQYIQQGANAAALTLSNTITKEKANLRYKNVVATMDRMANLYVSSITNTGGNAATVPTTFSFTVESERGDGSLMTLDENNAGVYLSNAAAIKRCIARSMLVDRNQNSEYYDPTPTTAPQNGGTSAPYARRDRVVDLIQAGRLANTIAEAEAVITVTKLAV